MEKREVNTVEIANCCLAVVDVQGKLATLMHNRAALIENIKVLIQAAKILNIPIIWCEQVPKALGPTVEEVKQLLADCESLEKSSFSCFGDEKFADRLKSLNKKKVILCGIETHVCIYQTAVDLIANGYNVNLAADAVSSRTLENKQLAISKMEKMGVSIYSTEMLIFELLRTANHPKFREVAKLIK
jgi:nicotinamidase-related amidase